ncbi:MAG: hypothetical protein KFB97_02500 [Cyanobium sp. M30B3]|jgi:hypothetical protein|nr:MAG: hypothetical protein KFB97_02500 [Cyanobium sp. M30B3]
MPAQPPPQPPARARFRGRKILEVGLIGAALGLGFALLLRRIVARTPAQISATALFWLLVLLPGFGLLAGMAIEAVRQLQVASPEPEYHPRHHHSPGDHKLR